MRTILHILTRPADELTNQLAEQQRLLPETKVELADVTGGSVDYDALVQRIFAADSVEVL